MSSKQVESAPTVSLRFPLEVDDGWPPVAVECLPFSLKNEGISHGAAGAGESFELLAPPLFLKGLSVGDRISPTMDAEGYVREWVHIARSSRSTVWLLRLGPPKGDTGDRVRARTLYELVADLRDIGCTVVDFESMGCFSVDVPEAVPLQNVDAILDRKGAEVAVAFPSLRHTELLGP